MHDLALGLAALGFSAATACPSSATTGRGSTGPRWPPSASAGCRSPCTRTRSPRSWRSSGTTPSISVIVAEDQEQVDKVLALREQLPALRLVVYDDARGMSGYKHDWLKSYDDVQELGRRVRRRASRLLRGRDRQGAAGGRRLISYTSGTTGSPKGAMSDARQRDRRPADTLTKSEDSRLDDNWLAYLPMAWVGDSLYTLFMSLMVGFRVNCPESPETVQRDLRELGPTAVLAPPRIWENMLTGVQVRAADAPRLKRWVFEHFRARPPSARRSCARDGKPVPLGPAAGDRARRVLRLRARCATSSACGARAGRYTGGAPLGPDTFRFFRSIGVNLKQVYGSTETTGLVSLQPDTEANPTTRRAPVPGHRGQDRRARRGAGRERGRLPGLLQERGGHARGHRSATAGSTPATPASSTRAGTWSSSTAPRTSAPWPTARRSRPSSSRTSSSSARTSARRWPSATSGPFVTAMIAIDPSTVGNWAERRGLAYTSYMDLQPEAGGARADPRRDPPRATRPCRRRPRSGASCC